MNRFEFGISMCAAIVSRGLHPIRAVYHDGICVACKHPQELCVGWHSSRYEVKRALADLGLR